MKHDDNCSICAQNTHKASVHGGILYEDDTWVCRHFMAGRGVPGWVLLQTQRHVKGILDFNVTETTSFIGMLKKIHSALLEVTRAERIYIASMNESVPHFHCHFIPRYAEMPKNAVGWEVFDLVRASEKGEYVVDDDASKALCGRLRELLTAEGPGNAA